MHIYLKVKKKFPQVFFNYPAPSTIVADTTCELLVVSRDDIDKVLQEFPFFREIINGMELHHHHFSDVTKKLNYHAFEQLLQEKFDDFCLI